MSAAAMRVLIVAPGSPEIIEVAVRSGINRIVLDCAAQFGTEGIGVDIAAASAGGAEVILAPPILSHSWLELARSRGIGTLMLPLGAAPCGLDFNWWSRTTTGAQQTSVVLHEKLGSAELDRGPVRHLLPLPSWLEQQGKSDGWYCTPSMLAMRHVGGLDGAIGTKLTLAPRPRSRMIQDLRVRLRDGHPVRGLSLLAPNAGMTRAYAQAGVDLVAINLEHSLAEQNVQTAIDLCWSGGTIPVIVTRSSRPEHVEQALRAGAGGIQLPNIESAEELDSVRLQMQAAMHRGDLATEGATPLLIAHIERVAALENIGSIAAVSGLDALFVASWDLAQVLGVGGDFAASVYREAEAKIVAAARAEGVALACGVSPADAAGRVAQGFRMLLVPWHPAIADLSKLAPE